MISLQVFAAMLSLLAETVLTRLRVRIYRVPPGFDSTVKKAIAPQWREEGANNSVGLMLDIGGHFVNGNMGFVQDGVAAYAWYENASLMAMKLDHLEIGRMMSTACFKRLSVTQRSEAKRMAKRLADDLVLGKPSFF